MGPTFGSIIGRRGVYPAPGSGTRQEEIFLASLGEAIEASALNSTVSSDLVKDALCRFLSRATCELRG